MMEINKFATNVEKAFNITDSVPVVAIVGSVFRQKAAVVQFLAAAIFACMGFIGHTSNPTSLKWSFIFDNSCDHMIHGALNYIRALGELLLAITIVGSFGLLVYQLSSENGFNPIINYEKSPLLAF